MVKYTIQQRENDLTIRRDKTEIVFRGKSRYVKRSSMCKIIEGSINEFFEENGTIVMIDGKYQKNTITVINHTNHLTIKIENSRGKILFEKRYHYGYDIFEKEELLEGLKLQYNIGRVRTNEDSNNR